jgi:hypothetical protein
VFKATPFRKLDISAQNLFLERQVMDKVQKPNSPTPLNHLFAFGVD